MLNTNIRDVANIKKYYLCESNHIEYSIYVTKHKVSIYL